MKLLPNQYLANDEALSAADSMPPADWACVCLCDDDPDDHREGIVLYCHRANADPFAAAINACHGLDLPANVEAGILAKAADLLSIVAEHYQDTVGMRAREILAKLRPAGSPDAGNYDGAEVSRYYAIVAADRSGPAYGVGESPEAAKDDFMEAGFEWDDTVAAVEITPLSYAAVKAGNPDAWLAVED